MSICNHENTFIVIIMKNAYEWDNDTVIVTCLFSNLINLISLHVYCKLPVIPKAIIETRVFY